MPLLAICCAVLCAPRITSCVLWPLKTTGTNVGLIPINKGKSGMISRTLIGVLVSAAKTPLIRILFVSAAISPVNVDTSVNGAGNPVALRTSSFYC